MAETTGKPTTSEYEGPVLDPADIDDADEDDKHGDHQKFLYV
ncbi:MAG: hypothetical protein WC797_00135 [Candidatus Paceibacterota bacterium]|jgi:hypothetical protein